MNQSELQNTFKSSDTEEPIDIYFYRRLGYRVALFSAKHKIRPNTITIISIFWGVLAGHLYYYNNIWINVLGIIALIIANTLDSADGQLARMTNDKSELGRILDGLAGNLWFLSIYIHIGLRLTHNGFGPWIWIIGIITGISHIFQAAIADYYRNGHLYFVKGEGGNEFRSSRDIKKEYEQLSWRKNFWMKLFMYFYHNYTREQELFTGNLQKLVSFIHNKYPNQMPQWLREGFRTENKPLMKYTNILSFNTRAIALWISILIQLPLLYWYFELTVLNIILIYTILKQQAISKKYLNLLQREVIQDV
ncbi:MAG TPA: CDP-alcohol phosphatidyltransferase family protein [Bacteroidales bacterium]|jgi:phosphatidylglycerophosphate synthase|nr:CDP-alcohol phosphatidyltransferase family protein [Bacteroidales bacterium]HQQ02555.1 CDP-alcohol phosphatidyltransferase family protein [Bacteroidales bacterium]